MKVATAGAEGPTSSRGQEEAARARRGRKGGLLQTAPVFGQPQQPSRRSPLTALFTGRCPWSTAGSKGQSGHRGRGTGLLGGGGGLSAIRRAGSCIRCCPTTGTTAATEEIVLSRPTGEKSLSRTGRGRAAYSPTSFPPGCSAF